MAEVTWPECGQIRAPKERVNANGADVSHERSVYHTAEPGGAIRDDIQLKSILFYSLIPNSTESNERQCSKDHFHSNGHL